MALKPYTVPAAARTDYPEVRVSALSLTQSRTGGPLVISYEIARCRTLGNGAVEDAPGRGGTVSGSVQLGLAAVLADTALAQAVVAITARAEAEALAAGLLESQ